MPRECRYNVECRLYVNLPESSNLGTPFAEILLKSMQGGVERVRSIRPLSASLTTEPPPSAFNKCGVLGSDTTLLTDGCAAESSVQAFELAARASITSGDGCLGLGTRFVVKEAFKR